MGSKIGWLDIEISIRDMIKHLLKISEVQAALIMIFCVAFVIFVPYFVGLDINSSTAPIIMMWIIGFLRMFGWLVVAAFCALGLFGIGWVLCNIFNRIVRALENRKIQKYWEKNDRF